jgi:general secretion pathway protein G
MFCQRCGNQLAPGARFCNACGTPVTVPAAPVSMARPALVTVIAVLHFVGGPLMLLGAVGVFTTAENADRFFALGFGAVFVLLGAASLATGIGLWKMREWGRVLQIVLACIGLLGIPLGTIISILLLVYFTRPHVKLLFSGRRLDQLAPDEVATLSAAGGGASGASVVVIAGIVVLVVVAFSGILAAIAIPNLLTAMQRSRQLRTIADMRRIAVTVETYRAEHNAPPQSIPPAKDAWTNNLRYASDGDELLDRQRRQGWAIRRERRRALRARRNDGLRRGPRARERRDAAMPGTEDSTLTYCQKCGNQLAPGAQFCNQCGTPVTAPAGGAPVAGAPKSGCGKGAIIAIVAVVAVFVVVAIIGILAAIAIPNLLTAKQRAMQKRTIADMRSAATSVELYRASHNALPDSIAPQKDGWGHDFRYKSDGTNYWIVSAGKDGVFEEDDPSSYTPGPTTNFDADIVMQNGELRRWPGGVR